MNSSHIDSSVMIKITPDPLALQEVTQFVTDPSAGGISIFMGKVNVIIIQMNIRSLFKIGYFDELCTIMGHTYFRHLPTCIYIIIVIKMH